MVDRITAPSPDRPLVNAQGIQEQQTRFFLKVLADRALIIGQGSPVGVVEALQGASYMDEIAPIGSVLYMKQLDNVGGDKTQGWVLIG